MNLWYKKASVFIVAGMTYIAGQYFRGVWFVNTNLQNFCRPYVENGQTYCNSPYLDSLGWPLIDLGQMLAIVAVILLFANAATFRKWLKFTIFYIPIAVLLVFWIYPIRIAVLSPVLSRSQGIYPFGKLFVLITFGIVLWNLYTTRRAKGRS